MTLKARRLGRFINVVRRVPILVAAVFACAGLLLAGCGDTWTDVKRGLGMEKVVPDEFAVTASAPLAVPPDFTLRPPRPGAAPTQEKAPVDQARQTVFRASDTQLATLSPAASDRSEGEDELLKRAGAESTPCLPPTHVARQRSLGFCTSQVTTISARAAWTNRSTRSSARFCSTER